MGKNKKGVGKDFYRKTPPRMLPQSKAAFERYNQNKWRSPLPDEYKKIAKAIAAVEMHQAELTLLIDPNKKFTKELYQLALTAINHSEEIDYLLKKLCIRENNRFLGKWIAKVLVTELIWGKQCLRSSSNEVEAIKYYEEDLRESFVEVTTIIPNPLNAEVADSLPVYVRINTLSMNIDEALQAFEQEGWKLLPKNKTYSDHLKALVQLRDGYFMRDFHISELLIFFPGSSFYKHPGYLEGKFVLQDKGSCLSSFLLNPKPGSVVLDVCAAPGLKTNHIANIMNNNGTIYANDIHPDRSISMRNLLELTSVNCVQQLEGDYLTIQNTDANYILIDPTCSYSGMFFNKKKAGQADRLKRFKFTLSMALRYSLQNFPNVKRVIYTVCSIFPEECEQIVDDALKAVGNSYSLLNLKEKLWNEWISVGSKDYDCGDKCICTMPEVDFCQGYFIAAFERNFDVPVPPYERRFIKKSKNHPETAVNNEVSNLGDVQASTSN